MNQINAGNDLLEPGTNRQWKALLAGYKDQSLPISNIDTSVKRILRLILSSKKMQDYKYQDNPDLETHAQVARRAASEGMVLLKNMGALPLPMKNKVALFGSTSYSFISGGTGSGDVN